MPAPLSSVLQCVAVCYSVLQCLVPCYSVLRCDACVRCVELCCSACRLSCSVVQCGAAWRNMSRCVVVQCNACTATPAPQHVQCAAV